MNAFNCKDFPTFFFLFLHPSRSQWIHAHTNSDGNNKKFYSFIFIFTFDFLCICFGLVRFHLHQLFTRSITRRFLCSNKINIWNDFHFYGQNKRKPILLQLQFSTSAHNCYAFFSGRKRNSSPYNVFIAINFIPLLLPVASFFFSHFPPFPRHSGEKVRERESETEHNSGFLYMFYAPIWQSYIKLFIATIISF